MSQDNPTFPSDYNDGHLDQELDHETHEDEFDEIESNHQHTDDSDHTPSMAGQKLSCKPLRT